MWSYDTSSKIGMLAYKHNDGRIVAMKRELGTLAYNCVFGGCCTVFGYKCPFQENIKCKDVTPDKWEKVFDEDGMYYINIGRAVEEGEHAQD